MGTNTPQAASKAKTDEQNNCRYIHSRFSINHYICPLLECVLTQQLENLFFAEWKNRRQVNTKAEGSHDFRKVSELFSPSSLTEGAKNIRSSKTFVSNAACSPLPDAHDYLI